MRRKRKRKNEMNNKIKKISFRYDAYPRLILFFAIDVRSYLEVQVDVSSVVDVIPLVVGVLKFHSDPISWCQLFVAIHGTTSIGLVWIEHRYTGFIAQIRYLIDGYVQ